MDATEAALLTSSAAYRVSCRVRAGKYALPTGTRTGRTHPRERWVPGSGRTGRATDRRPLLVPVELSGGAGRRPVWTTCCLHLVVHPNEPVTGESIQPTAHLAVRPGVLHSGCRTRPTRCVSSAPVARPRRHQAQRGHQAGTGEDVERATLVVIEDDALGRRPEEHGDDAVAAGQTADLAAVAVEWSTSSAGRASAGRASAGHARGAGAAEAWRGPALSRSCRRR